MAKSMHKNPMATNPVARPGIQNPDVVRPRNDVEDFDDPYRPDEHGETGMVCSRCGAIYFNQHWSLDEAKRTQIQLSTAVREVICPGCKKISEGYPEGIVTLRGDYWPQHENEILNLIRNEERRAVSDNPLERIIDIRHEGEELILETTNERLAQRIGQRIDKAHNGHVEYKWSGNDHLLRVYWQRSLSGKS
jgi:NMD protein affecting ribosome stability and mRNA decay